MESSWKRVESLTFPVEYINKFLCFPTYQECDDKTFEQRHSRLELDERKRKRWDIQRIRELREHERLVNKQKQRESAQWEHILTSFYPEDGDGKLRPSLSRFSLPQIRFSIVEGHVAQDCACAEWILLCRIRQTHSGFHRHTQTSTKFLILLKRLKFNKYMCFMILNELYIAHHNLLGLCHQLKIRGLYGTFNFSTQCIYMGTGSLFVYGFCRFRGTRLSNNTPFEGKSYLR